MTPGDPSQLLKAWIECRDAECEGRGVNFGHFYVDDARAVLAKLEALRVVADAAADFVLNGNVEAYMDGEGPIKQSHLRVLVAAVAALRSTEMK
jgi:hypothetical protein